jgi:hypothetical protein
VGGCSAVGRARVCYVTRRTGRRGAVCAAERRYAAATKENTKRAVKDRYVGSTHSEGHRHCRVHAPTFFNSLPDKCSLHAAAN